MGTVFKTSPEERVKKPFSSHAILRSCSINSCISFLLRKTSLQYITEHLDLPFYIYLTVDLQVENL